MLLPSIDKYDREMLSAGYDFNPYLESLTVEELIVRYNKVCRFWLTMPRRVHPNIKSNNILSPWYWRQKLMHLENKIRSQTTFVLPSFEHLRPLYEKFGYEKPDLPFQGRMIVKFGSIGHMQKLHYEGEFYFNTAAEIERIENDHARQDYELSTTSNFPDGSMKMFKADGTELKTTKNFKVTSNINTDYYMFCFASEFDPGLFDAFKAEAAVLFPYPQLLDDLLRARIKKNMPDYYFSPRLSMPYYDLFLPDNNYRMINASLSKDITYAYQKEGRYTLIPNSRAENLKPIKIKIGDVSKISQLYFL